MIRVKLVEAREAHGYTQKRLAALMGVAERTVQSWELGERGIRGKHRQALCDVLGLEDADLDVFRAKDAAASLVVQEETPPLYSSLDSQLLAVVLQWPRGHTVNYIALQKHIQMLMEVPMNPARRNAVRLLATLPVEAFGLSMTATPLLIRPDEVLPFISAGIVAAYKLSRGVELPLADSVVATYLPTLTTLAREPQWRTQAATMAAQAYSLSANLGWHVSTNEAALKQARLAEKYAAMAQDAPLLVDAVRRTAVTYQLSGNYAMALQKIQEARHIMEHDATVPAAVKSLVYVDLATFSVHCDDVAEAKQALRLFRRFRSVLPKDTESTILFHAHHNEYSALCLEGEALAAMGEHRVALDLYEQIWQDPSNHPKAEKGRVEALNHQLHSMLALPNADKQQCIKLLADAISSSQAIESELRFGEALQLLSIMEARWPHEHDIAELREVATHW